MKIVVIGGTGLIGSKLVALLEAEGHETVAASPRSGVNTLTGEGVAEALAGADCVVDVSNSPSFDEAAVLDFFRTSTSNLLEESRVAGVGHDVALSVVGTQRLAESAYFRAKIAQEQLISDSGLPFTIVHATQFFEFVPGIADSATEGDTVRLANALIQPMAGDDVAAAVLAVVLDPPVYGVLEVAGPERFPLDELVRLGLYQRSDPRLVVADPEARYFGARLDDDTLLPGPDAVLSLTRFEEWMSVQ